MHYLTVQDMLWIHLQITKQTANFDFATLEEATYYQYSYGTSKNLVKQAARFVEGFVSKAPLHNANEACAFVGVLTFLEINGQTVDLTDSRGAAFMTACASGSAELEIQLSMAELPDHSHTHNPDVRGTVSKLLRRYPQTMAALFSPVSVA